MTKKKPVPPELVPHVEALLAYITPPAEQKRIDALTDVEQRDEMTRSERAELLRLIEASGDRSTNVATWCHDRMFTGITASNVRYLRALKKMLDKQGKKR